MSRRERPALCALAIGASLLLASLYLPWQTFSSSGLKELGAGGGSAANLRNLFGGSFHLDGWSVSTGSACGLAGLALLALALVRFLTHRVALRLPLTFCALTAAYFTAAVGAGTRAKAEFYSGISGVGSHYGYAVYIAASGVLLVLLGAAGAGRRETFRDGSLWVIARWGLAIAFLVAALLPWWQHPRNLGIDNPPLVVAAGLACLLVLPLAAGAVMLVAGSIAVLAGATLVQSPIPGANPAYGGWLGVDISVALLLTAAGSLKSIPVVSRLSIERAAIVSLALVVVASLFLPWQHECYRIGAGHHVLSGCYSAAGWPSLLGTTIGALAIASIVAALNPRLQLAPRIELAGALGVMVVTLALVVGEVNPGPGVRIGLAYGAWIGCAASAGLIALAVAGLRLPPFRPLALRGELFGTAIALLYVLAIVLSWWPIWSISIEDAFGFERVSWLTVAGVLVAVRVMFMWTRVAGGRVKDAWSFVALPLFMLAIAALGLILARGNGISWAGMLVVTLCTLLAALGFAEQRGGLATLRVPELLRVDRL